jgi:7-carboxy-7-deazaguanine synthase
MKVNEIFYSIQGEGLLVGTPTIFIRTSGCNLRCTYCDTTYAYHKGKEMSIQEILTEIGKISCTHICLTGGEPLHQKDTPTLIDHLLEKHYSICLETNGSYTIKNYVGKKSLLISLDIKCPSSESHKKMILTNISSLTKKDQLKFIIKNKHDYTYAKNILYQYKPTCNVFFQPVWGNNPQKLAAWILRDALPVRLSLQLHKYVWGTKKGV